MQNYREILYKNYFSTQMGRDVKGEIKGKFEEEKRQFSFEIIPLAPADKAIKILDIGCGIGSLMAAFNDAGYHQVEGIDLSPEQIKIAHENGIQQAKLGDLIPYLKENEECFDLITGMDIIEHFTKDELCEVLAQIKKALKPNGRVLFRTPNADAPLSGIYSRGDLTHECFLNYNSAEQVMMAMEYQNIEILPSKVKSKSPFKEFIRSIAWWKSKLVIRFLLFASGRTTDKVILMPNLIIKAQK